MKSYNWRQMAMPLAITAMAAVTLISACSRDAITFPGQRPVDKPASLQLGLEVSSKTAAPGQRVSVAIKNYSAVQLGGLQGRLSYNSGSLRFVGQDLDAENVTILGTDAADDGSITVVSMNARARGLPARTAVITFDVLSPDYASTLHYRFSAAGNTDGVEVRNYWVSDVVFDADDLDASLTADELSDLDWERAVDPILFANRGQIAKVPGALVSGLMYGDCNESGTVNVVDVLCIQRVAANLDQPIVGTGAPLKDVVIAGNVNPPNLPGLGEGNDATPPGIGGGGSATNIDIRTINVLDGLDVARCAALIAGVCPLGGAGPWTTVAAQIIPGREASQFSRPDSTINCPIAANLTLNRSKRYIVHQPGPIISTVCDIGSDAGAAVTLTIDAGALIVVDSGTLVVHRNAQIFVNGTVAEPVHMTCLQVPVTKGCWGGLYVSGNAPVNNGPATSPAIPGRQAGGAKQATGEGGSGLYGGDNVTDNSGVLRFLIVEGAGSRFTATNERNGITLQAVGSGTTVDYVMSTNGLDDGIEFFGGTVNVKHAFIDNTEDDSFDWVGGWSGKLQFGISRGCNLAPCDNGIEGDNFGIDGGATDPESTPRSSPTLYNMTLLGQNLSASGAAVGPQHGLLLRANTAGTIRNILAFGYRVGGLDIDSVGQATASTFTTFGLICNRLGGGPLTPGGDDALSIRFGYFGQNFSTTAAVDQDPDAADPRNIVQAPADTAGGNQFNCGGYGHSGANLEARYMAAAGNNLFTGAGNAAAFIVDPWGTNPDFRLLAGAPAGAFSCATPPSDGFFDTSATYCGAAPPQNTLSVNLPWFSGWTLPRTP